MARAVVFGMIRATFTYTTADKQPIAYDMTR